MKVLTRVGQDILTEGGQKNSNVYRGILKLLGDFGYASIEEVIYGFDLTLQEAINRFVYLERAEFIVRFPSRVKPESFFCLTPLGRQAVLAHKISDYFTEFHPSKYRIALQHHHRMNVKANLALSKVCGSDFKRWVSEHQLRKERSDFGQRRIKRRIFDGEFYLTVHKEKYAREPPSNDLKFIEEVQEVWRCGLEVELTLKSAMRYEKQFHHLYNAVYDAFEHKQKLPLVLFLYQSRGIYERLVSCITSGRYGGFGRCIFLLGDAERLLKELNSVPLTKIVGK